MNAPHRFSSGIAAARKCWSSRIVHWYPAAASAVGRSGSQTRSASQAPLGRRPVIRSSSPAIRDSCADAVALGERGEDRLVQAAAQQLDLAARHERPQPGEELRALGGKPLEQGTGVVEREADARVALQRLEHRQVGAVVDLGEHPAEVAHRLVVVDREGQRDAGGHGRTSVEPAHGACAPAIDQEPAVAPAAAASGGVAAVVPPAGASTGRYSRSTYSWSMRVVEKRQMLLAIALRISWIQRSGRPSVRS